MNLRLMEVHMNNIILIGMPGSGKSSLGVVLAKKIGFGFKRKSNFKNISIN